MKDIKAHFESKFLPVPFTGCWIWGAGRAGCGYGQFQFKGRQIGAHRASWILYRGEIPAGAFVLHKCDVRCCVNPDHLFLGSNKDNVKDMISKGRQVVLRGEKHGCASISEKQAREILADTRRNYLLAAAFGLGTSQISKIKKGRQWKHLHATGAM